MAAERGSLSKAASESFITVPALSQQVAALEADVGFRLFERKSTGVVLTKAGEDFYRTARDILASMEEGRERGRAAERAAHEVLTVGLEDSEVADYLVPIVTRFKAAHPQVSVEFFTAKYELQGEALRRGDSDLFVAPDFYPHTARETFVPLYRDPYCCCVPPGHRLASKEVVTPADLAGERVFMESFEYAEGLPLHVILDYVAEDDIDKTPFSISLPSEVLLEGGVLMRLTKCAHSCTPPLVSVPFGCEVGTLGIFCRKDPSDVVRAYARTAIAYFDELGVGAGALVP